MCYAVTQCYCINKYTQSRDYLKNKSEIKVGQRAEKKQVLLQLKCISEFIRYLKLELFQVLLTSNLHNNKYECFYGVPVLPKYPYRTFLPQYGVLNIP